MLQIFTLYRGIFTERFRVFHAEDGQKKAAAFGEAAAGKGGFISPAVRQTRRR